MSAFIPDNSLNDGEPVTEQPRPVKEPETNSAYPTSDAKDEECVDCCLCCSSSFPKLCDIVCHWLLCIELFKICTNVDVCEHCCNVDCSHCCMSISNCCE